MNRMHGTAKINIKLLIILLTIVVVLGVGAFTARHIRRRILSARDLAAGQAAFDKQEWSAACKHIREYLGRNPDDVEMLRKYAEANLSVRPVEAKNIMAAVGAYRRVLRLATADEVVYEKLARLYRYTRNAGELAYIARKRLENAPDDVKAPVWLAEAMVTLKKTEEASEILLKFVKKLDSQNQKYPEYVEACGILSEIAARDESGEAEKRALEWLNRGVKYDPRSVEALVYRARFRRMGLVVPGVTREQMLVEARKDLARADEIGAAKPLICLALSGEWMWHDKLVQAADALKLVKDLDKATLDEHFLDPNDWIVAKFLASAELSMRMKSTAEGVSIVDETLEKLKKSWQRPSVLPLAVRLYVAAGKVPEARCCLDEYLEALKSGKVKAKHERETAYLRALVARQENRFYVVIDILEPTVVRETSHPELWALLGEAYSRTDQPRRAVRAIIQYLRLRSKDKKMALQLSKEYIRLRDWSRAFETARLADSNDIVVKLLRIEARTYLAVERRNVADKATLDDMSKDLATLRKAHPDRVDIRILQARIAVEQGKNDIAEKELTLAIKECSEPLRADMQLALHYYRTDRATEAVEVCRVACERHSAVAEPWLVLSQLHVTRTNYDDARACLRNAMDKVAGRWEKRAVTIRLALLELLHGDRPTGIDLLKELAQKDKHEIRARLLLLGVREVREDQTAAQKLVDEIRQTQGESGLMWRLHQASLWLSGDNWRSKQPDITEALKRCIDSDPEWSAPALLLVEMYRRLGSLDREEETCRQALIRNPSATDVAGQLVSILERQRRFSDAQEILNQIETNPRAVSSWHVRLALGAGDFSRAIDELKLRVSNDKQDADSRILLARLVYRQTKDVDQAFRYLKEAEALAPESVALAAARVSILNAEGRAEEARKILDDRVKKHKNFVAYVMRASYLASVGEVKLAEKDCIKLTTFPKGEGARGYELLARFYVDNNKPGEAVRTLEKGAEAHPNDISLKRNLMVALFSRRKEGDRQRADEILASLDRKLPNDPGLMRLRAMELLRSATPESIRKAQEILERVVRMEPTSVTAHLALIEIAMRQGKYKDARDLATQAMGTNRENVSLMLARARAEWALKNVQMAVELARMAVQEQPHNADAHNMLVEIAIDTKDDKLLKEADIRTSKAIEAKPSDENLQVIRARLLHAMGRTKKAIENLETYCSKEGGKSIPALLTLADLHRIQGDMTKAGERIQQAEKLAPADLIVIRARLILLAAEKNFIEIARRISKRLDDKPKEMGVVLTGISILSASESMRDKKEALRLCERALEANPDLTAARLQVGFLAYQTGQADRARKAYEKVLERHPDDVQVLNDLAWILADHYKEYKKALKLADKGLRLEPDNVHLLDTRGMILSNLPGRLADARKDFEKHLALTTPNSPRRAKALLQLGRLCAKSKELAQARQYLEQATEIDRKHNLFTVEERLEIKRILGG